MACGSVKVQPLLQFIFVASRVVFKKGKQKPLRRASPLSSSPPLSFFLAAPRGSPSRNGNKARAPNALLPRVSNETTEPEIKNIAARRPYRAFRVKCLNRFSLSPVADVMVRSGLRGEPRPSIFLPKCSRWGALDEKIPACSFTFAGSYP